MYHTSYTAYKYTVTLYSTRKQYITIVHNIHIVSNIQISRRGSFSHTSTFRAKLSMKILKK